jgi:histidinol phosphatase-like enzyme
VPGRTALFLDWGGTLVQTRDNRTVIDDAGHPVLLPNVAERLARERPRYDACFIVSNQARISRGEISATEVLRR